MCRCGTNSARVKASAKFWKFSPATSRSADRFSPLRMFQPYRVRALRKAFDETLADPQFVAAAKEANIYINPMGGEELQATVGRIAGPSERVLTMFRQATEFKGAQKTGP